MARKRPKYPDQLLHPILKPNGLVPEEETRRLVFKWKAENLCCLASHYGINPEPQSQDWTLHLALRLAEDLGVPGLQVVDRLPRGRGRPANSGKFDRQHLRRWVELLQEAVSPAKLGVLAACQILSKASGKGAITTDFKKQKPTTLEVAYHKAVKELRTLRAHYDKAFKELRDGDPLAMCAHIKKETLN